MGYMYHFYLWRSGGEREKRDSLHTRILLLFSFIVLPGLCMCCLRTKSAFSSAHNISYEMWSYRVLYHKSTREQFRIWKSVSTEKKLVHRKRNIKDWWSKAQANDNMRDFVLSTFCAFTWDVHSSTQHKILQKKQVHKKATASFPFHIFFSPSFCALAISYHSWMCVYVCYLPI